MMMRHILILIYLQNSNVKPIKKKYKRTWNFHPPLIQRHSEMKNIYEKNKLFIGGLRPETTLGKFIVANN